VNHPRRHRLRRQLEYTCLATDHWQHGDATPKNAVHNPATSLELLALLSSSPHGATEALLVRAHGFSSDMISGLVRAGLATAERETMKAGAKSVEIVRVRIY